MGRKAITEEQRHARLSGPRRRELQRAVASRDRARERLVERELHLGEVIKATLDGGATYRDIAALLGVPVSSVHLIVSRAA